MGAQLAPRSSADQSEDRTTPEANGEEEDVASDGYERKDSLEEVASSMSARDRLEVYVTPTTFEAALFPSEGTNQDRLTATHCILKDAFVSLKPGARREKTWADRIEPLPLTERGAEFIKLLKSTKTRKGDFSQALAARIRKTDDWFVIPDHLQEALRWLVDG